MLSKCANPSCSARFRYLNTGQLFRIERPLEGRTSNGSELEERLTAKKGPRHVEFFWLCDECSELMTLTFENGAVKARRRSRVHRAAS